MMMLAADSFIYISLISADVFLRFTLLIFLLFCIFFLVCQLYSSKFTEIWAEVDMHIRISGFSVKPFLTFDLDAV